MRVEAFNVPVLGSSKMMSTKSLSYNVKDIASLILNDSAAPNPYKPAYQFGFEYGMHPEILLNLVDKCYTLSDEKCCNEGYTAIIGSLLAGYLMGCWSTPSKFNSTGMNFGYLVPFLGVYTEIATRMYPNDTTALNTYQICDIFKNFCGSYGYRTEDSFELTVEDIQGSKIMPIILKKALDVLYVNENIPGCSKTADFGHGFVDTVETRLREYLMNHGENDIDYVTSQILFITESFSTFFSFYMRTNDVKEDIRIAGAQLHEEVKEYKLDLEMDNFSKYVNRNVSYDTEGFAVSTILYLIPSDIKIADESAFSDRIQKAYPLFIKEMEKYFTREWYPEFLSTCKDKDIRSRSAKVIFSGIFESYIEQIIEIFIQYNIPKDEPSNLHRRILSQFNYGLHTAWDEYMKNDTALDEEPNVDSDSYFKYIMSFLDQPMENEETYENHDESAMLVHLSDPSGNISFRRKHEPNTGNYRTQIVPMSASEATMGALEAKSSIRYQEKQGSRIGKNIGDSFKMAMQNAGHIVTQFKKISAAVYKWITTDGNNDKLVLDGRKFTFLGLIKRLIISVGFFHVNIVAGIVSLVFLWSKQKKANKASKRKMIMMLEEEIRMVDEKIQDASSDGNRKAKYALMRSKNQLQNAVNRLKYGMGVELKDEEQPAVREVRDRAVSGGKIAPNDSLRTVNSNRSNK